MPIGARGPMARQWFGSSVATAVRLPDVMGNVPIVGKIALPLVIVMALSVAMSWYVLLQTTLIKADYQHVVDFSEKGKSAHIISGAIRSINVMAREMATADDEAELEYMKDDISEIEKTIRENAGVLKAMLPDRRGEIESSITQFSSVLKTVEAVRQAALKGDHEGALHIMRRIDLRSMSTPFEVLNDDVGKAVAAADAAAQVRYDETVRLTVIVGVVGSALTLGLVLLLALHSISRPLGRVVRDMTRLAEGDLDVVIKGGERRDEIGATARAVIVFQRAMNEARHLRSQQDALRAEAEAQKRRTLEQLADDFQAQVSGVVSSVGSAASQMRTTADQLTFVADNANRQSDSAAGSAREAVDSVGRVAAATEQLSASIREISERVDESWRIAQRAVAGAERSEQAMNTLLKAAEQIGDVVKLISSIASRTNLLALNATIEAARAGEAGRGFAIVAQEVKALANQTAEATSRVEQQIDSIRGASSNAAGAIHEVGAIISRISEIAAAISAAVVEQNQATHEIAQGASRASDGASSVRSKLEEVIHGAGHTSEIACLVLSAADGLVGESQRLGAAVDRFVVTVRSA